MYCGHKEKVYKKLSKPGARGGGFQGGQLFWCRVSAWLA